jgi:2-methylisocitrate lyase-like PEP mutase family enzyme
MSTLRKLISQKQTIIAPGAFDGLSARLVEQSGFSAIYASGGAIARSCGFPDIGLICFSEVLQRLQHMREVTTIPIIADADTGFGNEVNVRRTIKEYKRIGIEACHIEDQVFPKRCGHLDGKLLIPTEEMALKVKAAKETAGDEFLIIARTDAIAVEGFDQAIERANAYADAGADIIFVEAPTTEVQIEEIASKVKAPKLINMFHGGKTPVIPVDKLKQLGYQIVIIPSDLQRAAIKSMQHTLNAIKQDGDSSSISDQLATFNERENIIDTKSYLS